MTNCFRSPHRFRCGTLLTSTHETESMASETPRASESMLNVQEFLDARKIAPLQWMILGLCFLVQITEGFHSAAMAFVAPVVTQQLGISRLALGQVLSAVLVGLGIGALVAGPVADTIGRRRVLIASVMVCSVGSLLTASANGATAFMIYRLLAGIGIGAAMPNCTTLAAEFLPTRRRALLSNLMFCGFPLGASLGGFLCAWLIPHSGWRSVFLAGGLAPLLLAAALTRIPESIGFMAAKQWPAEKIRAVLERIAGDDVHALARIRSTGGFQANAAISSPVSESKPGAPASVASPLGVILAPRLLLSTLMLWLTYFMGLFLFYLLTGWMPTLVREAGYSVSRAAIATALFPLGGGVGALFCGWLMDRANPTRVVASAYLLTAALMLVLAASTHSIGSLMVATLLAGIAMNGAQTSMPVLAASSYPTRARASGVSWMLGAGRAGGVLGAFGGGVLMQAGFSMVEIIGGLAIPAALAAMALFVKERAERRMG